MRLISDLLINLSFYCKGIFKNFFVSKSLYTCLVLALISMPIPAHALVMNSDIFYLEEAKWYINYYHTFEVPTVNADGTTTIKKYGVFLKGADGHADTSVVDLTTSYANSNFKISTSGSGTASFTVNGQPYYVTKADGSALTQVGTNVNVSADTSAVYNGNYINLTNSSGDYGGAFSNAGYSIGGIIGDFIANTEVNGGALSNVGSINPASISYITGNFIANKATATGGAIYNAGTSHQASIDAITANFIGNSGTSGGAIHNYANDAFNASISSIVGDFISNSATNGGAIANVLTSTGVASIGTIKGSFVNNYANASGGAIYNEGNNSSTVANRKDAKITTLEGDFIGNTANIGGAIYNSAGSINDINGSFYYNKANNFAGAIYNVSKQYVNASIGNIIGDFVGNTAASSSGGAIYNVGANNAYYDNGSVIYYHMASISAINGNFIDNTATNSGGAIYNQYGTIASIIGSFYNNTATNGFGGAIYNNSASGRISRIDSIKGDFIGNTATSGGAIYNNAGSIIATLNSSFYNNTATDTSGGAIYNNSSTITSINGSFDSNIAETSGGAIYNQYGTINSIIGSFYNNTATNGFGGAIFNEGTRTADSKIGNISAEYFYKNTAGTGGAIYNNCADIGNIIASFIGNAATNGAGGAIYNYAHTTNSSHSDSAKIGDITGDFISNSATQSGGAIYNYFYVSGSNAFSSQIGNINGDFIANSVNGSGNLSGGAIYNNFTSTTSDASRRQIGYLYGDFTGNSVTSSNGTAQGGAIYNYFESSQPNSNSNLSNTGINTIYSSFTNNYASGTTAQGGAIWTNTSLSFTAANKTNVFSGNYTLSSATGVKEYNAIYFQPGSSTTAVTRTLDFNLTGTGGFIFNDSIISSGTFYVDIDGANKENNIFTLNNTISTTSGSATVTIDNATLKLGSYKHTDGTITSGLDINKGTYTFTNAGLTIDYLGRTGTEILVGATINGSGLNNLLTVTNINNGIYQLGSLGSEWGSIAESANALQTVSVSGGGSLVGQELYLTIGTKQVHSLYDGVMGGIIFEVSNSGIYGANSTSAVARFIYAATNLAVGDTMAQLAVINGAAQMASTTGVNANTVALNRSLKDAINLRNVPRGEESPGEQVLTYNSKDYIGLWVAPMYTKSITDGFKADDGFAIAYNSTYSAINLGIDKTFTSLSRYGLGFSTGSGTSTAKKDFNGAENEFEYLSANAYTSLHLSNWTLGANLNFTRKKSEITQDLSRHNIEDLYTNLNSSVYGASIHTQYTKYFSSNNHAILDGLHLVPHIAVDFMYIPAIDYTVKQTSSYLNNNAHENALFEVALDGHALVMVPVGLKLAKDFEAPHEWKVSPNLDLGLTLTAGNLEENSIVRATGFDTRANLNSEAFDMLTGNIGLSVTGGRKNVSFTGGYDADISKNRVNHNLKIQAQCDF